MARFYKKDELGRLVETDSGAFDSDVEVVSMTGCEFRDMQASIQSEKRRADKAEDLNRNLLRIMKERSNAERGIRPKKEKDGYIVLESRQWYERYQVAVWHPEVDPDMFRKTEEGRSEALRKKLVRFEPHTAVTWKTIIQTPYDVSLPKESVEDLIEEEIVKVLAEMGCLKSNSRKLNGTFRSFGIGPDGHHINGRYRWVYRANYRSGYWEVECYTLKALDVPIHRQCERTNRTKKKKQNKKKDSREDLFSLFGDFDDTVQ